MGPDPQRVEEIIARALALDATARAAWLDEASQGDASLHAWLEALVRARQQQGEAGEPAEKRSTAAGELDGRAATNGEAGPAHIGLADANGDATSDGAARSALPANRLPEAPRPPDARFPFLAPTTDPQSLGRLADYEILDLIGQGDFGIVFRAWNATLRRVVAIKVLRPEWASDAEMRERVLADLRATAAVRHANVIAIHALGEEPVPFVVMDLIPGTTLQERIDAGPLDLPSILRIGGQIAAGLAAAHHQGLLHGALQPANVLLENGLERVTITNFGFGRHAIGSPTYMAPEQALAEAIDDRADLFSLGTVLYTMCTGRPPFGENRAITILKRVVEDRPRDIREVNPDVPPWLCEIIDTLHAKAPADRYQSAYEVAQLLAHCLSEVQMFGEFGELPAEQSAPPPPRPRRAWRVVVTLLGLLIIFADLLAAYFFDLPPFRADRPREPASQTTTDTGN